MDASRCPACAFATAPPAERCPRCGASMSAHEITGQGRVLARTRLRGREDWIVLVELDDEARMLARTRERVSLGSSCRVRIEAGTVSIVAPSGDA